MRHAHPGAISNQAITAMRRFLAAVLASTMLVAPARGQLATIDVANLTQQIKGYLAELRSYATQLQQLQTEVNSYTQLATTAASLIQHPNLGQAQAMLGAVGVDSSLPISPYAVQALIGGYGGGNSIAGLVGKVGLLGSLVNTSYSQDSLGNTCTDDSFSCRQQQQIAWSNAGTKGILGKLYTDLNNHIPVIAGLRAQLAASTDPAQRENIIATLNSEQTWTQNATGQANLVLGMAEAQTRVAGAQRSEKMRMDADALIAAARN